MELVSPNSTYAALNDDRQDEHAGYTPLDISNIDNSHVTANQEAEKSILDATNEPPFTSINASTLSYDVTQNNIIVTVGYVRPAEHAGSMQLDQSGTAARSYSTAAILSPAINSDYNDVTDGTYDNAAFNDYEDITTSAEISHIDRIAASEVEPTSNVSQDIDISPTETSNTVCSHQAFR